METENDQTDVNNSCHQPNSNDEEEKKDDGAMGSFFDPKILRMMEKMGYQSGKGLGKEHQGITEPVKSKLQIHRRGLGLKIENVEKQCNFPVDSVTTVEKLEWLHCSENQQFSLDTLITWSVEDKPITSIEDEHQFCDKDILHKVTAAKNIFDHFDLKDLLKARARANPFETIHNMFFMNRAALKMANIDAATGFMFTKIDQNPFHKDNWSPYYFADVCAGPGGFTEYILWRKKWRFKGFGFTLRGANDFKLTESVCASPVTFLPLYGAHGDGNVCCPQNIDDFRGKVLFETKNEGVHFMMSDGGFSVEGNENMQEVLSKNIYICQCLVALEVLRKHGHFVTKMFDLFTCFSVGLLYLIHHCFEKVCILKPNSSRPANSERYIVCGNYRGREDTLNIRIYLRKLVDRLWELRNCKDLDITEIVPLSILKNDHNFYSYIFNSNNRIASSQIHNLYKMAAFCEDPTLTEPDQNKFRQSCLEYWQIPDVPRRALPKYSVEEMISGIIHNREMFYASPQEVTPSEEMEKIFENLKDWSYTLLHCKKNVNTCNLYAGMGLSKVYKLHNDKWVRVKNLQLVRGTVLYGELVKEKIHLKKSDGELQHKFSLHVIDAIRLGDTDLSEQNFEERQSTICLYCKAVNHEFRTNTMRIRPKVIRKLESICTNFHVTRDDLSKNFISRLPVLGYDVDEEFFEVNSVLFLKTDGDQTFYSTYDNRKQLFISDNEDQHHSALDALIHTVRSMRQ